MSWSKMILQRTFALARRSAVLGLSLVLPVWTASAQVPKTILEVNVTGDPTRDNGQPVVAINPTDPDNLVFISTDHRPAPAGQGQSGDKWHCFVAYSADGGATWTEVPWPYGDRPLCGDPYLDVDSQGIFYIGFNRLGCTPPNANDSISTCPTPLPNFFGVARSLDGGQTWSDPVNTQATVAGTPRMRVDKATGRVYGVGAVNGIQTPSAVSVSADQGLTFGPRRALPSQPFGNQIAVHDGILATATALQIVGGTMVVPAAPIFFVSLDDGQTFTSYPVTDSAGNPVPPPSAGPPTPTPAGGDRTDPIPWISADPTQPGRFAILLPRNPNLEVYVTEDAGQTWTGPAVVAAPGAIKPWIEFGSTGLLGVMWRTTAVDAYAVLSFDHGDSFNGALRVNETTHNPFVNVQGDEWSRIVLDGHYVYVTWSDRRSGAGTGVDGIVGRVPVKLFKCGHGSENDPPGCEPRF